MESREISPLNRGSSEKSPERSLWTAVLARMLSDFIELVRGRRYMDCEAMLRSVDTPHVIFICETAGIHPDKVRIYMTKQLVMRNYIPSKRGNHGSRSL